MMALKLLFGFPRISSSSWLSIDKWGKPLQGLGDISHRSHLALSDLKSCQHELTSTDTGRSAARGFVLEELLLETSQSKGPGEMNSQFPTTSIFDAVATSLVGLFNKSSSNQGPIRTLSSDEAACWKIDVGLQGGLHSRW